MDKRENEYLELDICTIGYVMVVFVEAAQV